MQGRSGHVHADWGRHKFETEIIRIAELSWLSTSFVWVLWHQMGAQYSATEKYRARVAVRRVLTWAYHVEPASLLMRLFLVGTFAAVFSIWAWKASEWSSVTPRYTCWCSCQICFPSNKTFSSVEAEMLCKWNTLETIFDILGWSCHFLQ